LYKPTPDGEECCWPNAGVLLNNINSPREFWIRRSGTLNHQIRLRTAASFLSGRRATNCGKSFPTPDIHQRRDRSECRQQQSSCTKSGRTTDRISAVPRQYDAPVWLALPNLGGDPCQDARPLHKFPLPRRSATSLHDRPSMRSKTITSNARPAGDNHPFLLRSQFFGHTQYLYNCRENSATAGTLSGIAASSNNSRQECYSQKQSAHLSSTNTSSESRLVMPNILNTTAALIMLFLAATAYTVSKIDNITAAVIVSVPLILHFLPRAAGHAVRALARHRRWVR
jgi:hypothetical protein